MFTVAFAAAILSGPLNTPTSLPVESTVRIIHRRGDSAGVGSGTVVGLRDGKSIIITAGHVCPNPGVKIIVTADGKDYVARWLGASATDDLAAIEVDATLPVAPLATVPPPPGSPLRQVGYSARWLLPFPRDGTATSSGFVQFNGGGLFGNRSILFAAIPVRSGDSGSGVFNAAGELVGVCSCGSIPARDELAVPIIEVRKFLDGLGDGR